jgi:hypothetical protein
MGGARNKLCDSHIAFGLQLKKSAEKYQRGVEKLRDRNKPGSPTCWRGIDLRPWIKEELLPPQEADQPPEESGKFIF